ncbi:MAG: flagellar biosynthesis anti-sigma factor FlgM [Pirellulaceae bacterium]|jgi:negative regulator of flagellin synthesis FlgM|nr:flagellar biosynthesis anti-sigma factor FlgM [Pirellulaceae bacterium]MDG2468182.1 flagellar biosynthesis anti-sigma factor FlgM [Pirellulaceae bacterium]
MQINGPFSIHGAQPVQPSTDIAPVEELQATESSLQPTDELDISSESTFLSQVRNAPDIRADRVADIRSQIESGVYETSEKLDVAVGRLFDEFA